MPTCPPAGQAELLAKIQPKAEPESESDGGLEPEGSTPQQTDAEGLEAKIEEEEEEVKEEEPSPPTPHLPVKLELGDGEARHLPNTIPQGHLDTREGWRKRFRRQNCPSPSVVPEGPKTDTSRQEAQQTKAPQTSELRAKSVSARPRSATTTTKSARKRARLLECPSSSLDPESPEADTSGQAAQQQAEAPQGGEPRAKSAPARPRPAAARCVPAQSPLPPQRAITVQAKPRPRRGQSAPPPRTKVTLRPAPLSVTKPVAGQPVKLQSARDVEKTTTLSREGRKVDRAIRMSLGEQVDPDAAVDVSSKPPQREPSRRGEPTPKAPSDTHLAGQSAQRQGPQEQGRGGKDFVEKVRSPPSDVDPIYHCRVCGHKFKVSRFLPPCPACVSRETTVTIFDSPQPTISDDDELDGHWMTETTFTARGRSTKHDAKPCPVPPQPSVPIGGRLDIRVSAVGMKALYDMDKEYRQFVDQERGGTNRIRLTNKEHQRRTIKLLHGIKGFKDREILLVEARDLRDPDGNYRIRKHCGQHPEIMQEIIGCKQFGAKIDYVAEWIKRMRSEGRTRLAIVYVCNKARHRSEVMRTVTVESLLQMDQKVYTSSVMVSDKMDDMWYPKGTAFCFYDPKCRRCLHYSKDDRNYVDTVVEDVKDRMETTMYGDESPCTTRKRSSRKRSSR